MTTPYTPEYKQQLVEMHETTGWGGGGHKHARAVLDLCREHETLDVLDYGCGKGTLKFALTEYDGILPECIKEYDPGIPGKDAPPEPADIVVCTDVLEHVEPHLVDEICADLARVTRKVAYVLIVMQPSGKVLPDGRNAHLTLMSSTEWQRKLFDAGFIEQSVRFLNDKTIIVVCEK